MSIVASLRNNSALWGEGLVGGIETLQRAVYLFKYLQEVLMSTIRPVLGCAGILRDLPVMSGALLPRGYERFQRSQDM